MVSLVFNLGSVGECAGDREVDPELSASRPYSTPAWTPDGTQVVFDRYVVDVDGINLRSIVPDSQLGGRFDRQSSTNVSPAEPVAAYTTLRHGNGFPGARVHSWDIVSTGLDGTSYERLTSEDSRDISPIWSPDGGQIAFFSDRDLEWRVGYNLFVMDRDGSNVRNLTPSIDVATDPVIWSPNGDRIAFWVKEMKKETDGLEYPYDHMLHIIDADGSNMRTLNTTGNPFAWSPDGKQLAFMPERRRHDDESPRTIVVSNVDGESDMKTITVDPPLILPGESIENAGALVWSEDGSDILLVTCHSDPSEMRTYSIDATGPAAFSLIGRWHVPANCISHGQVSWSPDRSLIAVWEDFSQHHTEHRIFVISPDGSRYRELAVRGQDGNWIAANAESPSLAIDISACSKGVVVPSGDLYSGLVRDCETLLVMSNDLARANLHLNWGAEEKIDSWDGVGIGGNPPRVTRLSFGHDFGFVGSLPAGLGGLDALHTLSIENGSISGPIPPQLANLRNLRHLTLDRVKLSGPIPPELGSLPKLQLLILSDNNLSGAIPPELGALTNLDALWLDGNSLSGPIPPALSKLPKLRELYLSHNLLEGEIPFSLTQMPTLQRVNLEGNNLTGCVPEDFLDDWRYVMDEEIEACADD